MIPRAHRTDDDVDAEVEAAYEALYAGNKAKVREVGDALLAAAEELDGVTIGVSKLYVWLATNERQFAVFFPASGRRVTLRLRLEGTAQLTGRAESTADRNPDGRFDAQVFLSHVDHVDGEVRSFLRKARDLAR